VGNKDRIFSQHVTESALDEILCPTDMSRHDRQDFSELMMDVTQLPGMYFSGTDETSEAQGAIEGAAAMMAQVGAQAAGRRGRSGVDPQWMLGRKASLCRVKTPEQLYQMIKDVRSSRTPALEKQEYKIRAFMRKRHYSGREVTNYLQHGLWTRIIQQTFDWYVELMDYIRQINFDHGAWSGGLAEAMVTHHGKRLKNVREHAPDYRTFILRVYSYLRDSARGHFYHESMVEGLWKHPAPSPSLGDKSTPRTKPEEPAAPQTGCGYCRNKVLHQKLSLAFGRDHCPLKELTRTKAKSTAPEIIKIAGDDLSAANLKKVVKEQLELAK
jgi:hypothetical protein